MPRMAQVLITVPSASARATSPVSGAACRSRIAVSAADATCAWTPHSRLTTSATLPPACGSTNCRRSRQASA